MISGTVPSIGNLILDLVRSIQIVCKLPVTCPLFNINFTIHISLLTKNFYFFASLIVINCWIELNWKARLHSETPFKKIWTIWCNIKMYNKYGTYNIRKYNKICEKFQSSVRNCSKLPMLDFTGDNKWNVQFLRIYFSAKFSLVPDIAYWLIIKT